MNVALGDSTVGPTCWTGGLIPFVNVGSDEQSTFVANAGKVISHHLRSIGTGLSSYVTLFSSDTLESRADLPFRIYAACTSETLSAPLSNVSVPTENVALTQSPDLGALLTPIQSVSPLLHEISTYLPQWSQARLGRMFGVTRQAWRDWIAGRAEPRDDRRARMVQVAHALRVRAQVAGEAPSRWFEAPVWPGRAETPESLTTEGKDRLVSTLALRSGTLIASNNFSEFIDRSHVERESRDSSLIYAPPFDDE